MLTKTRTLGIIINNKNESPKGIKMKKIFAAAVAILMISMCLFAAVAENVTEEVTEEPGNEINWEYSAETKTLKLTGAGDMHDYSEFDEAPWLDEAADAKNLEIGDGITSIGSYAFANMTSLENITLPAGIKSIGEQAFYNTYYYNLNENRQNGVLYIKDKKENNYLIDAISFSEPTYAVAEKTVCIADYAFSGCMSLSAIIIQDGVAYVGEGAFENCTSLRRIELPETVLLIGEGATYGCEKLATVKYAGSPKSFARISVLAGNGPLREATLNCAKTDDDGTSGDTTAAPSSGSSLGGCKSFGLAAFAAAIASACIGAFIVIKRK